MNRRKAGLLSLLLFTVVALIHFLHMQKWIILQEVVLMTVRWIFIASLVLFAVYKKSLTTWILVAMAIGVEIGLDFPAFSQNLQFLSKIFLRLVKTIVGRMGWKSLLYFEVVTTIALLIGLVFINITKAGIGIKVPEALLKELPEVKVKGWQDHIIDIFPENIIKSIYEGNVLPIVLFSVVFGIALALLNEQKKKPMLNFAESLAETMFRFTNIIMYFAPFGVGAAIAVTVGHLGIDILKNLALLLVTLYLALIAFLILVLLPIAIWVAKIPIKKFIQAIREPVSIAFATTSSDPALPKALENMEKFGVPRKIVSFVIPTG